jgi:hypothetical protein
MHGRLGTDANGSALLSEMRELLAVEGVTDPGLRDAHERLWRAIESETARYYHARREAERDHSGG